MTELTEPTTVPARRPSIAMRFAVAFLVGLLLTLAVGVGALYAYDQQYAGRILPGVQVGSVNLSGLTEQEAAGAIADAYASLAEGEIILDTPDGKLRIPYRNVGRRVDADSVAAQAVTIGRSGGPLDRGIANARTALNGVVLEPQVSFDADAVASAVEALARTIDREPVDAFVTNTGKGFELTEGQPGRRAARDQAVAAILEQLGDLDLPATLEVDLATTPVEPDVTTAEARSAQEAGARMAAGVVLTRDTDTWSIPAKTIRPWISFGPDGAGGYAAQADTTALPKALKKLAKQINQAPRNATFKTRGSKIVGVVKSRNGKGMDVAATASRVESLLALRAQGPTTAAVAPVMQATAPALTTEAARAAIPKMRKISSWTTYFPISEKNGFGVNIWIPAMDLDGYVVAPGAVFDFWDAIGPVTRAHGYRAGGAIINGRTEPQGALAGGICSTSTTLFNAALRAGYEMGARRNHYYYIDRYPIGLDATVFKSGSGSVQTMSFTNDTKYPILIRGYRIRDGSSGYVRFELWSVPPRRKVSFSRPIVRNVRPASDTIQYTSSLKPGVAQRIEYPVDGKQVWVTRTVRDRKGKVLHKETYYSNYARITGITLVGKSN